MPKRYRLSTSFSFEYGIFTFWRMQPLISNFSSRHANVNISNYLIWSNYQSNYLIIWTGQT